MAQHPLVELSGGSSVRKVPGRGVSVSRTTLGAAPARHQRQCQRERRARHSGCLTVTQGTRRVAGYSAPTIQSLADVAEPYPAGRVGAELDEGDLVSRDEYPPALLRRQREDGRAVGRGQRGRQVSLKLRRVRVGVDDELSREGLNADLNFHADSPRSPKSRLCAASR